MNIWKVIFATLVIFGAGVVTGGLLVSYSDHVRPHAANHKQTSNAARNGSRGNAAQTRERNLPNFSIRSKDFLDRLDRELKLTPGQREKIGKILADGQARTRALWKTIEPDVHVALAETKEKIREELTPEQQARCAELFNSHAREPRRNSRHDQSNSNAEPVSTNQN